MYPFENKTVCVIGNSRDRLPDPDAEVYVYCNRIPKDCSCCDDRTRVIFWDSCEDFDKEKHDLNIDVVYIYDLRKDVDELINYLYEREIYYELYCPACRSEHEDNDQIEGIHWALPLTNRLQGRPFTGFLAIYKALIDGARKIYVTGFDLYRDKETKGWRSHVGPHNIHLHANWLWKHCSESMPESRIVLLPDTLEAVKECKEFFTR
jgi:hypothetical protein